MDPTCVECWKCIIIAGKPKLYVLIQLSRVCKSLRHLLTNTPQTWMNVFVTHDIPCPNWLTFDADFNKTAYYCFRHLKAKLLEQVVAQFEFEGLVFEGLMFEGLCNYYPRTRCGVPCLARTHINISYVEQDENDYKSVGSTLSWTFNIPSYEDTGLYRLKLQEEMTDDEFWLMHSVIPQWEKKQTIDIGDVPSSIQTTLIFTCLTCVDSCFLDMAEISSWWQKDHAISTGFMLSCLLSVEQHKHQIGPQKSWVSLWHDMFGYPSKQKYTYANKHHHK